MVSLYLDLETLPDQTPGALERCAAAVKAPATHKRADSIAAWLAENREAEAEQAWLKTALDGTYGQVCAIAWAVDDGPVRHLVVGAESRVFEGGILADFWLQVQTDLLGHRDAMSGSTRPTIVGHNVAAFDIPFLWRRCVIHALKPPLWLPRNPKPWSDSVYDTMLQWAGDRGTIGLDRLAKALGMDGKSDITGADVWPMAQRGEWDRIGSYCAADVELVRAVHKRLTFA